MTNTLSASAFSRKFFTFFDFSLATRYVIRYTYNCYRVELMIKSFRNRAIKRLFEDGNRRRINPQHADKIERILDRLDSSLLPQDMNLPGYRLHRLKGELAGHWAVDVVGNWRITFRFDGPDVFDVDYVDYH